jgi:hypothetical protein
MSEKKLRRLSLASAALVACVSAQAEYQSPDGSFRMSGFGTIGASRSSTDDAIYNSPGQGGGSTTRASFNPDSKLAVQGNYRITPTVSATGQVLVKYNELGQYQPAMSWAFANWQAAPNMNFRAGKLVAPIFMISDFRDVGYANTVVRPPLDVYGQVPASNIDGVDGSYQLNLGDVRVNATLLYGDVRGDYAAFLPGAPPTFQIKHLRGFNLAADLGNGWVVRGGHVMGHWSVKSSAFDDLGQVAGALKDVTDRYAAGAALAAAGGVPGAAAASQSAQNKSAGYQGVVNLMSDAGVDASFSGIGLAYEKDEWVGALELTRRVGKGFLTSTTGWYGMLGYRVKAFTPYVGLSRIKSDRRAQNTVDTTVLPQLGGLLTDASNSLAAKDPGVNAYVNAVLATQKQDERTSTLGVRWDASSSLAVKFQFDRISKPADSSGMFLIPDGTVPAQKAFIAEKRTIRVMTLSVDFVF